MELKHLTEDVAYIPGAVNIGVIKTGDTVTLIDTGLDKDSGRGVRKILEAEGLKLGHIVNTHSHADHFGGNDYLVRNLGAQVYAPPIESGIIQNPLLEPVYLFHGATPIKDLRNKFVLAKPSPVHHLLEPGVTSIEGKTMQIIPLPGHSFNQMGVLVDDIMFCADTVFSERVIEKYRIPVVQDVGKHLETLEKLRETNHSWYVPSHTKPTEDIIELVDRNLETVNAILEDVQGILDEPKSSEEVQTELCISYGLDLGVVQQYYLIHTTVMAYLGYLYEEGKVKIELKNNKLSWVLV
ncbi:MAG: MBL fold metallo-hydrolase [Candidatus Bathyarchaeota archaeon]|nr:MBL fold metallo-hydrolase [Candidatus Bathyarchaeota archaeon]